MSNIFIKKGRHPLLDRKVEPVDLILAQKVTGCIVIKADNGCGQISI